MRTLSRALDVVALATICLATACAPAENGATPGADAAAAPGSDAGQDAGAAPGSDAGVDAAAAPGSDAGQDAAAAPGSDAGVPDEDAGSSMGPGGACSAEVDCYELVPGATVFADPEGMRCVGGGCGCTSDTDCSWDTRGPFCNLVTLGCAECVTSAECGGDTPVCNGGACVQCVGASDCVGSSEGPYCAGTRCANCRGASDCATSPDGRLCAFGECQCDSNADCPSDRVCDDNTCLPSCTSDATCVERGVWAQNACDLTSGECVECVDSAHCAGATYGDSCLPTQTCGCSTNAHCATNRWGRWCDTGISICGCTMNSECPTGRRCDMGTCR